MATYIELLSVLDSQNMRARTKIACLVAAEAIRNEAGATNNHANRLIWAKGVFTNPDNVANQMLSAVVGQNSAVALGTILAASDATLQTAVNNAIDVLATGS